MSLFGKLVRTAVNVATLPVDVAKDAITLGGVARWPPRSYIAEKLQKIKDEAED